MLTMTVAALGKKKLTSAAAFTGFVSNFFLSSVSSNQSASVTGQHNGRMYSNHYCNHPKFAFSNEGVSGLSLHGWVYFSPSYRYFSSAGSPTILKQARNPSMLAEELETALDERRLEDAMKGYEHFKQLEGFPRKSLVSRLINVLAGSGDSNWLEKAYAVVLSIVNERKQRQLLDQEALTQLCLSLASTQMPVPASTVLRTMVDMEEYPSVNFWTTVVTHMVKTYNGACLASEIVIEMCYFFKDGRVDPRKRSNQPLLSMKPNTEAFNIALNGSLAFGMTRKAEELLELMTRVGVKADATSIALMAQIYESNGRREELKKLKRAYIGYAKTRESSSELTSCSQVGAGHHF